MFVEIVRLFLVVMFTAAGFWVGRDLASAGTSIEGLAGMLGCLVGYVLGGFLGRFLSRALGAVERRIEHLPPAAGVAGLIGAAAGSVLGATLAIPALVLIDPRIALPTAGLLVWICMYGGFKIFARQSEALFAAFGLSTRPLVRASPYASGDGMLIDTSAIMDGQLLVLARAGLMPGDLLVPRFVLDELQGLADARDDPRARRAQRGLESLDLMRRDSDTRVRVLDDEVPEVRDVDAKLAQLGRRLQVQLMTTDANLARVAEVQGVRTVNLRRLIADLSPEILGGESLQVALVKPGRQDGQGVGYLDDGSMVVVNDGIALVGVGTVPLVATSVVPTSAGRIVFAQPAAEASEADVRPTDDEIAQSSARHPSSG